MTVYYHLVGQSAPDLWGLSADERIARVLRQKCREESVAPWPESSGRDDAAGRVLLLRRDFLYDERLIAALLRREEDLALERAGQVVAVWTDAGRFPAALALLRGEADRGRFVRVTPDQLASGVTQKLRKVSPPFVLPVTAENASRLERHLFDESYKGVTDLVTKWVWPRLAERAVRFCVRYGIRPNHVTATSWVLAILVGILFLRGYLGLGLVLGWLMTFLDTVDGKLARVTVDSSRFGHFFDHVLDVVHPPLWYLAWGLGLENYQPLVVKLPLMETFWLLLAGYVGGRLAEALFKRFIGFSIFTWEVTDSVNRLLTARRNPCLILLSAGYLLGRPDLGFEAVTLWTLVSTLFLWWRLGLALWRKRRGESLASWLDQVDPDGVTGAAAWFVQRAR